MNGETIDGRSGTGRPELATEASAQQRVMAAFVRSDGTVVRLPRQLSKRRLLYDYLIGSFERGRTYSEREVNDLLYCRYPDVAALRRELVDLGYLARERDGSAYWRTDVDRAESPAGRR